MTSEELRILPGLLLGLYLGRPGGSHFNKTEAAELMGLDPGKTAAKYIQIAETRGWLTVERSTGRSGRVQDILLPTEAMVALVEEEVGRLSHTLTEAGLVVHERTVVDADRADAVCHEAHSSAARQGTHPVVDGERDKVAVFKDRGSARRRARGLGEFSELELEIKADPTKPEPYYRRGVRRMQLSNIMGAIEDFTSYLTLEPDGLKAGAAYRERGQCRGAIGDREGKIDDLTNAIAHSQDDPEAQHVYYLERGLVHSALSRTDLALSDFTNAIAIAPNNSGGYVNRAWILYTSGNVDAALDDCGSAVNIIANNSDEIQGYSFAEHADILGIRDATGISNVLDAPTYKKVILAVTKTITEGRKSRYLLAYAHFIRAQAYGALGKRKMQVTDLRKAILLQPSYVPAKAVLQELMVNTGHPIDDATGSPT